jgi:hypothetical protein
MNKLCMADGFPGDDLEGGSTNNAVSPIVTAASEGCSLVQTRESPDGVIGTKCRVARADVCFRAQREKIEKATRLGVAHLLKRPGKQGGQKKWRRIGPVDPDLVRIIASWPMLSNAIRRAMLALIG